MLMPTTLTVWLTPLSIPGILDRRAGDRGSEFTVEAAIHLTR